MFRNKGIRFFLIIGAVIFTVGVFWGSFYASGLKGDAFLEISDYLNAFFKRDNISKTEVFKNSLFINLKVFALIFLAGFYKITTPVTISVVGGEGFISGFTMASILKVFGARGLLFGISGIISALIFMVNLVVFGAWSLKFAVDSGKKDRFLKKKYMIVSIISITTFCVSALIDGYITTTFMGFLVNKL